MVNFCVVVGCSKRSTRDKDVKFFRLPKLILGQGDEAKALSEERRRLWLGAISRADKHDFKDWERICSRHFSTGVKADLFDKDNIDWVPTLHMGHSKFKPPTPSAEARRRRIKERRKTQVLGPLAESFKQGGEECMRERDAAEALLDLADLLDTDTQLTEPCSSIQCHQEIQACAPCDQKQTQTEARCAPVSTSSVEIQTDLTGEFLDQLNADAICTNEELYKLRDQLSHKHEADPSNLEKDSERVKYYTGLPNFLVLSVIFNLIEPYLAFTHRSLLTKFQQMMVVLMRLRLNLSEQDLAYRFCVSQSTISRIFRSTLDVMHTRLKHLIIWPEREVLRKTMPMQFRKEFGQRVAVIIDCFEIFIDRPSNLMARAQTWSNYKHHNTIKYLIGITPQSTTSFLSKAWGGRTPDKVITEQSGFLNRLDPGDIVLADRGFTISEMVAMQGATVHIPSFTRGKKQLSAADVALTRKIANVRIHVERVIGSTRQKYTILSGPIPIDLLESDSTGLTIMDKIARICCVLTNINPSVVDFE